MEHERRAIEQVGKTKVGTGANEAEVAQGKEVKGIGNLVFNLYLLVFLPFDKQIKFNYIILRYFKSFLESFFCRFTFHHLSRR